MTRYVQKRPPEQPLHHLEAALRRLPRDAAFTGLTAAWLHGIEPELFTPIEATLPKRAGISGRAGMAVRRSELGPDVVTVRGMRATSIARMLADLCDRLSLTEAVVLADAALHLRRVRLEELASWASANPRRHGIRMLRRVIELAEPAAESPMESRLRMVLVLGGLPRPKAQVPIHDASGRFVGRPDLYYEAHRLGIEYDGDVHRGMLAEDNRRQNRLLNAGVRLLRFTASDVWSQPQSLVMQVRTALVPAQIRLATPSSKKVSALSASVTAFHARPAQPAGATR